MAPLSQPYAQLAAGAAAEDADEDGLAAAQGPGSAGGSSLCSYAAHLALSALEGLVRRCGFVFC